MRSEVQFYVGTETEIQNWIKPQVCMIKFKTTCPPLLKHLNVLSWLRIHWDEAESGQRLKDCQDVERLWCPGPVLTNANHCLLSCKSAGLAISDPTFHCGHFLFVFIGCKAHTGPHSLLQYSLSSHSQLWRALVSDGWAQGALFSAISCSYLVTGCKCWQLFQDTRQSK